MTTHTRHTKRSHSTRGSRAVRSLDDTLGMPPAFTVFSVPGLIEDRVRAGLIALAASYVACDDDARRLLETLALRLAEGGAK